MRQTFLSLALWVVAPPTAHRLLIVDLLSRPGYSEKGRRPSKGTGRFLLGWSTVRFLNRKGV